MSSLPCRRLRGGRCHGASGQPPLAATHRHLLIIVDGLRPDYVTAEVMPNLTALGKRGVIFRRHHSVYPTVTRVNASSISTGAYPETHGLMGNSVFFPKVDATKFLDTADRRNLLKIAEAEGRLLTAPTLGEALQAAGRRLLVVSSGSSGSAFLNNHTVAGGAILHYQFALPERLARGYENVSARRRRSRRATGALDRYAVDAFLKVGLPRVDPSVTVMWLSDLDSVAHDNGIGAPATVATLKRVDGTSGESRTDLKAANLLDDYDIWVSSDHGFSTYTGARRSRVDAEAVRAAAARWLAADRRGRRRHLRPRWRRSADCRDRRRAPAHAERRRHLHPRANAGSLDGHVPGTLSFDAVRWQHERSAQILFSPDWTDATNAHGMAGIDRVQRDGRTRQLESMGHPQHADCRRARSEARPTSSMCRAPTSTSRRRSCRCSASPSRRRCRAARSEKALVGGPGAASISVQESGMVTGTSDGAYVVTATFSVVDSGGKQFRYFEQTKVTRKN